MYQSYLLLFKLFQTRHFLSQNHFFHFEDEHIGPVHQQVVLFVMMGRVLRLVKPEARVPSVVPHWDGEQDWLGGGALGNSEPECRSNVQRRRNVPMQFDVLGRATCSFYDDPLFPILDPFCFDLGAAEKQEALFEKS